MKNYLSLFLLIFPIFCFSQQLSDAKSFEEAIAQAKEKQKPVLLIISFKPPEHVQAQMMPNLLLKDPDVLGKIKENFVVFETNQSDQGARPLISRLKINSFPSYVFMHPNQDVFFTEMGIGTAKSRYLLMLQRAIYQGKEKSLTEIENEYLRDKNNAPLLKTYIQLRIKNGLSDNAELIEDYVRFLSASDFNDYQTVLFILQAGPYANSKAYTLARTNRKITDSIYKSEPINIRSAINNTIINNTLNNAIKTKNLTQAQSVANFTRATWGNNRLEANKSYSLKMMAYYLGVQDTTNYFKTAIFHYDSYYMNISADSIKKLEIAQRQRVLEMSRPNPSNLFPKPSVDTVMKTQTRTVVSNTFTIGTSVVVPGSYASTLNGAAWKFFETGTKNINHLTKAMIWVRRSLELDENSTYYDTLAHILYRLGYHAEAEKTEQQAIKLAKTTGRPFEHYEEELRKIKKKLI